MSNDQIAGAAPTDAGNPVPGAALLVTLTTFVSALLLFSIQPMFAKMALPILGGSTSVWAVALVFFQAALLAGYGYAHLINSQLSGRTAGALHLALFALALISLPIAIPRGWSEPPTGEPYLWQLAMFTVALGLPFTAIAANAPLLQAWFARSRHARAGNPYFLYAASNLGSFAALLGYPLLLEPAFGLTQLSLLWTAGFVALWALIGLTYLALGIARSRSIAAPGELKGEAEGPPPGWRDRAHWAGLSMVPAGLLTAITTHISTDIASAPLIWVVPLALYLLTFVVVFRERLGFPRWLLDALHLLAVPAALLQLSQTKHDDAITGATFGLAAFLLSTLSVHRSLYEARPAPRHLTEFYLWMSIGGVLGGLFAALVAPKIFAEVFEYPLLLALTFAGRPQALAFLRRPIDDALRLWLILAAGILAITLLPMAQSRLEITLPFGYGSAAYIAFAFAVLCLAFFRWPAGQLTAALLMFLTVILLPSGVKRGAAERSYFGVYRVWEAEEGQYQILTHGTTLHGAQRIREADGTRILDTTPATYYHPQSPMAQAVNIVRAAVGADRKGRFGVVGLGTGSLACLSEEGEAWRFFEIDPTVIAIATDPARFSFVSSCQPQLDVVIGDARLMIAREAPASFDLIIVDAFSSDAVPVHLMTAEALRLYASKLSPEGVLLLHISNRYLDLDAVVSATVPEAPELTGFILSDDSSDGSYATATSTVAVLSRSAAALEAFREVAEVHEFEPYGLRAWTDDYSDILRPVLRRLK